MLESKVEARLKRLENYGFKVLKLRTPGTSGVMDRMILMPKYSPGHPGFVELKAPSKNERPLQEAVRNDWRARGVRVLNMCDTIDRVDLLVEELMHEAGWRRAMADCDGPVWRHPLQMLGKLY